MIARTDYLLHFLAGVWVYYTFKDFGMIVGISMVVFFALMKDVVWDKLLKKGTFEWKDIACTVASIPVVILIEEIKKIVI